MDWRSFFEEHRSLLEENYPGLTLERFLKEALEIGGDGQAFLMGTPFAYLLGYAEFAYIKLRVSPDVLIPRPETEWLFEKVVAALKQNPQWKRLIDLGTGPGTLGLALKQQCPRLQLTLTDVSPKALVLAQENAKELGLEAQVLESDLWEKVTGLYDVIVSNPPYIPSSEALKTVHAKTHQFEPHLALYVDDARYEAFFRRLFHGVARHITADGAFFMEGHEDMLERCAEWARAEKLTQVRVEKDLAGRPRFLVASAPRAPIGVA
ncbi:MAG: N5-glutamine methyltransferase family protein [Bacteriovoracia bacterium]